MPFVELPASLLAPGVTRVRVHYRDVGAGRPILILHGGWGYEVYPFDRQIAALAPDHRMVIPDRTGYGGSGRLERQEVDFHRRAAAETLAVIAALGLDRPVLWGHSDGAVIARDPRTEPGELDALRAALGQRGVGSASRVGPARFEILAEGGHSPHSERATADEVTRLAAAFVRGHPLGPPAPPGPPDQS